MKRMMSRFSPLFLVFATLAGCGKGAPEQSAGPKGELTVLVGAGIRPAMEPTKAEFEKTHHCTVRVDYAGSGTLLGQLQAGVEADLYLPGDIFYIHKAEKQDMVEGYETVAWFVPVIGVQKGNPKGIKGLADLARKDVSVGLGRAEACAIGNTSKEMLAARGLGDKVKSDFEAMTVNRLANQVKLKALDAAIIWDAVAAQYPQDIDVVPIKDAYFDAVALAIAVLKRSKNKDLAWEFAKFAAGDIGAKCFRKEHYEVPGKKLRVGCGASFRPPVEDLAKLFEKQTGCEVLRDYGGSGEVLLQIEESKEGDVYICHDPFEYQCEDKKISARWHTIAYVHPVLAVQKGNPKKVKGLKDLLRKDLKIGLSHRKYSTRGRILWTIFRQNGMAKEMEKRKFFEERTSTLVNQLKLGAVDVATLWDAPAKEMSEIDVIPIEKKYEVDAVTSPTSGRTYNLKHVKVAVVRLTFAKEPLLAAQFAKLCLSDAGRKILKKHCFMLPEKK
ncbi:MAG: molybdate ABC transporter substrate-binding protein [Planctomycetes bacterium]|nr:molybdate ABC transporter substrate-binding protein [Planctomycetota bacterium]